MSEKPKTWAVIDDPPVHEQVPILDVPPGFPLDGMVPRVRVSVAEWEANDKPQMVVLVSDTTAERYSRLVQRDLAMFGRAVVLSVETEDRRMDEAHAAMDRIRTEIQEAVFPTPTNRHERRAAAAKARKGGW
jgi:hypothetical protein